MTIEELAQIMMEQFEKVEKRFESIDQKFEKIDLELKDINIQFNIFFSRLDTLEAKIDLLGKRMTKLEIKVTKLEKRSDRLEDRIDRHENQFHEIIDTLQILSTQNDAHFNAIDTRLDAIESQTNQIESSMITKDYLDQKINSLRGDTITWIKNADRKSVVITSKLHERSVFTSADVAQVHTIEIFPRDSAS